MTGTSDTVLVAVDSSRHHSGQLIGCNCDQLRIVITIHLNILPTSFYRPEVELTSSMKVM